ncbi:Transmembrane protein 180 [Lonchura striata]|uniref:Transmembrane protein 180 n=1 Tax=Lonchura striata TaxID=40157 RepID=A0A218V8G8_9PASE|nr:Transmembrane protein 180 [Lonchura striata domestica]
MKILWGIHANALAYSMTTLGAGMMNSIFNFYYVKLFLNRYKISETAFHVAQKNDSSDKFPCPWQVVFMIWNAINNPLFGYIQDNCRLKCCARRQVSILYGAPLYGLAFLLPWFPWRRYEEGDWVGGLQLAAALCAFDGLLTSVLLAQCALFAESPSRHEGRLQLIRYNQVATLLGSTSVLFCGLVSDNMENFAYFQAFTVLIAALATVCMCCTGKCSTSQYEQREIHTEDANLENRDGAFSLASVVSLTKQIMTEKNFLCFVTMNFFQVFHLAFYNNFMMIFADNLIPKDVLSSSVRSIMYGAGFICPQGINYARFVFYNSPNAEILIIVQASFSLFNLPLADIVDADLIKHKRRLPLSSMVFGTNALFTKPAQSLAPMVVVTVLNHYGYYNLNNVPGHPDIRSFLDLHDAMFYLVCLVPLCIAVLQILTWTSFSIQNSHLAAPQ